MRSIPLAMTWEMLRHGRWSLIAAALAANALPVFLFTALRFDGALDPADRIQIIMHVVSVQMNLFTFGAALFAVQGSASRLYAFPISTASLVAWHLIPAMAALALESLVSTALLNAIFDLRWPLWGPALFAAVAVAVFRAALWLTEKSGWVVVAITFVTAVLGVGFNSRYGAAFSRPSHYWETVTPVEILIMIAAGLVAYYVAILGVARNRCGQPPYSLGIVAWASRLFDSAPQTGRPFRTAVQAQLWFEWRRKGWAMPAAVVCGLCMGLGLWLIGSRDLKPLFDGFVGGGALLSLLALLAGLIMGNCGVSDSDFEMRNFLATRPISSTDLARTILKTAAKSVFVAWVIWVVSFLSLYMILWTIHVNPPRTVGTELGWWYFPATLLGAWTVLSLFTCIGLAGRRGLVATLFCGLFALFCGLSLFSQYALSHQAQERFAHGAAAVSGVVFVLGTVGAFVGARRRLFIGWPTLAMASSVWGALSALVLLGWAQRPAGPFSVYVFVIGVLALAVAPLATAPLALAWNRIR
jgi:hypothetical protein